MTMPGKRLNCYRALEVDDWMADAACWTRVELPWTSDPEQVSSADVAAMRQVCRACPVAAQCLAYVLTAGVTGGFWAGKDRTNPAHPDDMPTLPGFVVEPPRSWGAA